MKKKTYIVRPARHVGHLDAELEVAKCGRNQGGHVREEGRYASLQVIAQFQ